MVNDSLPWPNRVEVIDGIVSVTDVSQDPDLFTNDGDDNDLEMAD